MMVRNGRIQKSEKMGMDIKGAGVHRRLFFRQHVHPTLPRIPAPSRLHPLSPSPHPTPHYLPAHSASVSLTPALFSNGRHDHPSGTRPSGQFGYAL
jgi:hypothetical protein